MADRHSTKRSLARAAEYVRMSSGKQERSPAQQRAEIKKLAKSEGCEIVAQFDDKAVTGDSGPEARPGFQAMLQAAERGEFQVLLLWDGDRLGRFDSLDGAEYFNRLRRSGVRIVTCTEGPIDLDTFEGRLVHTVKQEGRHAFLRDLSCKIVRGQVANAREGYSNGGPPKFALDRVLVDPAGQIVRRLEPGEQVRIPGHRVRHVPGRDSDKLTAVRFAFQRFIDADISFRQLAVEMNDKGLPSPKGNGWDHSNLAAILRNPTYCGASRWGARSTARYHTCQGENIVAVGNGQRGKRPVRRPVEDVIQVDGLGEGVVSAELFDRVQRKIARRYKAHVHTRAEYPLSGLIYCGHCGRPLHGSSKYRRKGRKTYTYQRYLCQTYTRHGRQNGTGCGHFTVDAGAVEGWLVRALQAVFLGPGRDALVQEIKRQLRLDAKGSKADKGRLERRCRQLDQEVSRLVKAIRMTDAPELATELADARAERDRIKAELSRAARYTAPDDVQREAERIADQVWELGERLSDADPPALRELFSRAVSRIDCRWQIEEKGSRGRCRLLKGTVRLRQCELFAGLSGCGAYASA